jgi:uncharacterized protein YbjT (DUF2867 family)
MFQFNLRYKTVLVTGGTGFIGGCVVAKLVSQGHHVIVPTRRLASAKHLLTLPTVELLETPMKSANELAPIMSRVDAVINLIGILHGRPGKKPDLDLNNDPRYKEAVDPYGPDFGAVHVELPKALAELALRSGAKRMIQVSAYGTHLPRAKLPSMYLRSKAAGERAVLGLLGMSTTVVRPSVVFGAGDKFLNMFAKMQLVAPFVPLARSGCKFQPVFVEDLATAIVNALENPATFGNTYDLLGPETYTLKQIVQLCGRLSGHERMVISLPDFAGKIQASLLEMLPGPTIMSMDNFDSLAVDNAAPPGFTIDPVLGIAPKALSLIAPSYLANKPARFSLERARARR